MTAAAIIGAWLTVAVVFTGWLCQAARSNAPVASDAWVDLWEDECHLCSSTPTPDAWALWEHEQAMWDAANQPVFAVDKVSAL